jgi:hypothetical protein
MGSAAIVAQRSSLAVFPFMEPTPRTKQRNGQSGARRAASVEKNLWQIVAKVAANLLFSPIIGTNRFPNYPALQEKSCRHLLCLGHTAVRVRCPAGAFSAGLTHTVFDVGPVPIIATVLAPVLKVVFRYIFAY